MRNGRLIKWVRMYVPLCGTLLLSNLVTAQKDITLNSTPRTEYCQYPNHYEKITYYGEKNRYCTISWYWPDSSLHQVSTYEMIPKYRLGYKLDQTKILIKQGLSEINYSTGQVYLRCNYVMDALDGPFIVFYPDGSLKRRELYKGGLLKQSHCYNPDGTEQVLCPLYYQRTQFVGDLKKLDAYLSSQLQSIIDGHWVTDMRVNLKIDEAGQVAGMAVFLNRQIDKRPVPSDIESKLYGQVQQMIKNIPESSPYLPNWKPATADGLPAAGEWSIYANRYDYFVKVKHD